MYGVNPQQPAHVNMPYMPMDGQAMDHHQTLMWTQGPWGQVDSGVQSGAPSIAPSVMSGASSIHNELVGVYGSGMNTPVMNAEQYTLLPLGTGHSGTIPTHPMSDNGIQIHQDYELANRANGAIPELIKLLTDTDHVVVGNAAMTLHELSKKELSLRSLISSPQLVEALINAMATAKDNPDITKYAAGTFYRMSSHSAGLAVIFNTGGIRPLVRLLDSPFESNVYYALTILHNLLLHQEGAKEAVRREGGVERMVRLLDRPIDKFLAIDTDCLQLLCFKHQPTRMRVLNAGGPERLVNIMTKFKYEKLLWTTSRLLKVLSICDKNKTKLVECGGMQAMEPHLNVPSSRLVKNCLWALRNMSDAATKQANMHGLIRAVVQQLGTQDRDVVDCAVGILANLTCNNPVNKLTFCECNGIELMLRTLHQYSTDSGIVDSGLWALKHITNKHDKAEQAQNQLRAENGRGVSIICGFLQSQHPIVVRSAMDVLRNLASNPECYSLLHQNSCHLVVLNILRIALTQIQNAMANEQPVPVIDNVNMVDMVESAAFVLRYLAVCPVIKNEIINPDNDAMRWLILGLHLEKDSVRRPLAITLNELATIPQAAIEIDRCGGVALLTDLLQSTSQQLSTNAQGVLLSIQEANSSQMMHPFMWNQVENNNPTSITSLTPNYNEMGYNEGMTLEGGEGMDEMHSLTDITSI